MAEPVAPPGPVRPGPVPPGPVPPGTGWPRDPATAATPVASDRAQVRALAADAATLPALDAVVSVCRACPRLVAWREGTAAAKRAAFVGEPYWGRPVPGFGPADARIAVVGLAPAAHGGNRTGRIFTGDRSGDWLYAALHRAGLAVLPTGRYAGDGQRLLDTRLLAAVRCAPPENQPSTRERDTCRGWLDRELELLRPTVRAVVALGGFAWAVLWPALAAAGWPVPRHRPAFGHAVEATLADGTHVLGCYHPSQQNTFTRKLTEPMLDAVLARAVAAATGRAGERPAG